MKKAYKAYDGTVFDDESCCEKYELLLNSAKLASMELENKVAEVKKYLSSADLLAGNNGKYRDRMRLVDMARLSTTVQFLKYALDNNMWEATNE